MRHDDLTIELTRTDWVDTDHPPRQPCLRIQFDGTVDGVKDTFCQPNGTAYSPDELDIFYRQQASRHTVETRGMVSIADRLSGDYLLEVPAAVQTIERLVYAVRCYAEAADTDDRYAVKLCAAETSVASFKKRTFLVYDADGVLIRERSLIPSHVEI